MIWTRFCKHCSSRQNYLVNEYFKVSIQNNSIKPKKTFLSVNIVSVMSLYYHSDGRLWKHINNALRALFSRISNIFTYIFVFLTSESSQVLLYRIRIRQMVARLSNYISKTGYNIWYLMLWKRGMQNNGQKKRLYYLQRTFLCCNDALLC